MNEAQHEAFAGTARMDITPVSPVMQGGFGQRTEPNTGVLDRLFAKALYLRSGSEEMLLITADLIAMPSQIAEPVAEALRALTGMETRQICLCASHTHSGPVPYDGGTGRGVAEYSALLRDALVSVGASARDNAVPSRIGTGVGTVDVFFNRRTRGMPNHVDPRVAVLTVHDVVDDRITGVLFGVGCHPVTLGWDNMEISADFPGVAQRAIESALGIDNALFFNSTEGNVIPVTSPNCNSLDPRGYVGGTYADTEYIGTTIATEVVRVASTIVSSDGVSLRSQRRDLTVSPRNAGFDLESSSARLAQATSLLEAVLGSDFEQRAEGFVWALASRHVVATDCSEEEMRRLMIAVCEYLGLRARLAHGRSLRDTSIPVQVLHINDLHLLALPGEVLVEVGDEWTARTGAPHSFVVGLANAHHRYLPMPSHFAEADAGLHYETVTAGLEPNAMQLALDAAIDMG
jgi:hypothetical protein